MVRLADNHPTARALRLLLDRVERAWVGLEAPISSFLRPGLSDDEITDLAAPHGLEIPLELRVWWNWHDGAVPPAGGSTHLRGIGPGGYEFLPLAAALSEYELNRRIHDGALDSAGVPTTSLWEASWLPFMTQRAQRLYVDCDRVSFGEFTPVRLVSWEWEEPDVDRATSLSHAVTLWLWLLESGVYKWDHGIPGWDHDDAEIPDFAKWTGLV